MGLKYTIVIFCEAYFIKRQKYLSKTLMNFYNMNFNTSETNECDGSELKKYNPIMVEYKHEMDTKICHK